jgi:uncharacterized Fe-S radical SAM superfamily protein PflX
MPGQTTTADRLELARRHDRSCHLCQHYCGANRLEGERGPCLAGMVARVYRHRIECGEITYDMAVSHARVRDYIRRRTGDDAD